MAVLTQEQSMLRDSAEAWARASAPGAALRRLHGSESALGYEPETWREIAEMGWAGVIVPEEFGGVGLDHLSLGLVLEQLGRNLVPSPLIGSALSVTSALMLGGSPAQREQWLPRIAAGEIVATLAIDEGTRHDPLRTALTAQRVGSGWRLDGFKRPVLHGVAADLAVVVARTSGEAGAAHGLSLFLIETNAAGLTREPLAEIEARGSAIYRFDGVSVNADALLGAEDDGLTLLDAVLDHARAGLAAEMLGGAQQAFDTTLDYLKTRVQFGQIIGKFQALQHRAAALYGELEMTRSSVEAALSAIDENRPDVPELVSLAKAMAGDTFRRMAGEMIQLHGGIGMTEEHDAGLYLKRARTHDMTFGGVAFHRQRYARLNGF